MSTAEQLRPVETITALVAKAHRQFEKADELIAGPYKAARIAAGEALLELRQRIEAGEAGEVTWWNWYEGMFTRSRADAEKVMALARAPDPQAAYAVQKERNRQQQAKSRIWAGASQKHEQKQSPADVSGRDGKPNLRVVKSKAPPLFEPPAIRWDMLKRMEAEFLELLTSDEQLAFVQMIQKHIR